MRPQSLCGSPLVRWLGPYKNVWFLQTAVHGALCWCWKYGGYQMSVLLVGLPRYTRIVAAPRIAAMRIVFEYTHLYIRMQTNIHKNEKPYLFAAIEVEEITSNQQRWVRWVLKCLHFTFWAHDYLCRWAHDYLYRLIPVEFGDRSCPYKVKWRSGFQIVRYHSTNISIRIRDPIVVNTFVFTTYCIRESPSYWYSVCLSSQF